MKYEIKYKELESYLTSLPEKEFQDKKYNPNGIIKEAELMTDIDFFKKDKSKFPISKVIDYGMPFLLDALGNDLSICILTKRKFKLPTGRPIQAKLDRTIISNCRKIYGTPLNGCWVIPEQFVVLK
jgi:hypothetical protein